MSDKSSSTWWRWPLVPVVGFVASIAASIAMLAFQWFSMRFTGGFSEDGWYYQYILPVITCGVGGYAFVASTHAVAPSAKFISTTVMTTLFGVLLALNVVYAWGPASQSTTQSIQSTIGSISALIVAIGSLVNIAQTEGTSA